MEIRLAKNNKKLSHFDIIGKLLMLVAKTIELSFEIYKTTNIVRHYQKNEPIRIFTI